MRNLLIALLLLLWALLGFKMCNDYNKCCAKNLAITVPVESKTTSPIVTPPILECNGIICFEKNKCEVHFCDQWDNFRDSIITLIGSDQKLVITGYARQNESDYASLGLCRANSVKDSFGDLMDKINIETAGKVRVGASSRGNTMCDRISFDIIGASEKVRSSTLIYFPSNSTNKLADASVETYLDQVAERAKRTGKRVKLIGHTDDVGNTAANMDLGKRRANMIKDYLISEGVAASKIVADSQGESHPFASNNTLEGRGKNRRTELQIID